MINYETIVSLIANTRTGTGLRVTSQLDTSAYATGRKVSDKEMNAFRKQYVRESKDHGEWNYRIYPDAAPSEAEAGANP